MDMNRIKAVAYDSIAGIIEDGRFDEKHLGAVCGIVSLAEEIISMAEDEKAHTLTLEPKAEPTVSKQETVEEETGYALSEDEDETFRELMEEKPHSTPKPKAPADAVKKPKTDFSGAHKPAKDLGKLKACLDAGRSVKWCSDEFGVCDQTIRNWMKELQ